MIIGNELFSLIPKFINSIIRKKLVIKFVKISSSPYCVHPAEFIVLKLCHKIFSKRLVKYVHDDDQEGKRLKISIKILILIGHTLLSKSDFGI